MKNGFFPRQKTIAAFLSAVFFYSTAAAPLAEANFWTERRQAVKSLRKTDPAGGRGLYARLPGPLADALPAVSSHGPLSRLHGAADMPLPVQAGSSRTPAWLASLPSAYGDIRKVFVAPGGRGPMAVLIQDVHDVHSAQLNIAHILEHLEAGVQKNGGPAEKLLVGLEGASGAFRLEPHRRCSNPAHREFIAGYFLDRRFITGPEYFGITTKREPLFWGVENVDLYLRNVQAYRDGRARKAGLEAWIKDSRAGLEAAGKRLLSLELWQLHENLEAYHRGSLDLLGYIRYLSSAGRDGADGAVPLGAFPQVNAFRNVLALEESLNFKAVEAERLRLIEDLSRRLDEKALDGLVRHSLAYRMGNIRYGQYYDALKKLAEAHGIRLKDFPQFDEYIRYVLLAEKIDRHRLFDEIEGLKAAVVARLVKTPAQSRLMALQDDLRLLERLKDNEFGPAEWDRYRARRGDILDFSGRLGALAAEVSLSSPSRPAASLAGLLAPFENFYEAAYQRNEALVENLLAKAGESSGVLPVLVAGGFHTPGLESLLESRGVSYATLTPKIGQIEKGSKYLDVFAAARTPLENLLLGEKLYLSFWRRTAEARPASLPGEAADLGDLAAAAHDAVDGADRGDTKPVAIRPGGPSGLQAGRASEPLPTASGAVATDSTYADPGTGYQIRPVRFTGWRHGLSSWRAGGVSVLLREGRVLASRSAEAGRAAAAAALRNFPLTIVLAQAVLVGLAALSGNLSAPYLALTLSAGMAAFEIFHQDGGAAPGRPRLSWLPTRKFRQAGGEDARKLLRLIHPAADGPAGFPTDGEGATTEQPVFDVRRTAADVERGRPRAPPALEGRLVRLVREGNAEQALRLLDSADADELSSFQFERVVLRLLDHSAAGSEGARRASVKFIEGALSSRWRSADPLSALWQNPPAKVILSDLDNTAAWRTRDREEDVPENIKRRMARLLGDYEDLAIGILSTRSRNNIAERLRPEEILRELPPEAAERLPLFPRFGLEEVDRLGGLPQGRPQLSAELLISLVKDIGIEMGLLSSAGVAVEMAASRHVGASKDMEAHRIDGIEIRTLAAGEEGPRAFATVSFYKEINAGRDPRQEFAARLADRLPGVQVMPGGRATLNLSLITKADLVRAKYLAPGSGVRPGEVLAVDDEGGPHQTGYPLLRLAEEGVAAVLVGKGGAQLPPETLRAREAGPIAFERILDAELAKRLFLQARRQDAAAKMEAAAVRRFGDAVPSAAGANFLLSDDEVRRLMPLPWSSGSFSIAVRAEVEGNETRLRVSLYDEPIPGEAAADDLANGLELTQAMFLLKLTARGGRVHLEEGGVHPLRRNAFQLDSMNWIQRTLIPWLERGGFERITVALISPDRAAAFASIGFGRAGSTEDGRAMMSKKLTPRPAAPAAAGPGEPSAPFGTRPAGMGDSPGRGPRGYSGLDNALYTPVIQSRLETRQFAALKYFTDPKHPEEGLFVPSSLTVAGDNVEGKLTRTLTHVELDKIQKAWELFYPRLSPDEKDILRKSFLLFLRQLDDGVATLFELQNPGGNLPGDFAGTHFGVQRNQFYFDINRLREPAWILARQWEREVKMRAMVLASPSPKSREASARAHDILTGEARLPLIELAEVEKPIRRGFERGLYGAVIGTDNNKNSAMNAMAGRAGMRFGIHMVVDMLQREALTLVEKSGGRIAAWGVGGDECFLALPADWDDGRVAETVDHLQKKMADFRLVLVSLGEGELSEEAKLLIERMGGYLSRFYTVAGPNILAVPLSLKQDARKAAESFLSEANETLRLRPRTGEVLRTHPWRLDAEDEDMNYWVLAPSMAVGVATGFNELDPGSRFDEALATAIIGAEEAKDRGGIPVVWNSRRQRKAAETIARLVEEARAYGEDTDESALQERRHWLVESTERLERLDADHPERREEAMVVSFSVPHYQEETEAGLLVQVFKDMKYELMSLVFKVKRLLMPERLRFHYGRDYDPLVHRGTAAGPWYALFPKGGHKRSDAELNETHEGFARLFLGAYNPSTPAKAASALVVWDRFGPEDSTESVEERVHIARRALKDEVPLGEVRAVRYNADEHLPRYIQIRNEDVRAARMILRDQERFRERFAELEKFVREKTDGSEIVIRPNPPWERADPDPSAAPQSWDDFSREVKVVAHAAANAGRIVALRSYHPAGGGTARIIVYDRLLAAERFRRSDGSVDLRSAIRELVERQRYAGHIDPVSREWRYFFPGAREDVRSRQALDYVLRFADDVQTHSSRIPQDEELYLQDADEILIYNRKLPRTEESPAALAAQFRLQWPGHPDIVVHPFPRPAGVPDSGTLRETYALAQRWGLSPRVAELGLSWWMEELGLPLALAQLKDSRIGWKGRILKSLQLLAVSRLPLIAVSLLAPQASLLHVAVALINSLLFGLSHEKGRRTAGFLAGLLSNGAVLAAAPAEGSTLWRAAAARAAALPAHGLFNLAQYGISRALFKRAPRWRIVSKAPEIADGSEAAHAAQESARISEYTEEVRRSLQTLSAAELAGILRNISRRPDFSVAAGDLSDATTEIAVQFLAADRDVRHAVFKVTVSYGGDGARTVVPMVVKIKVRAEDRLFDREFQALHKLAGRGAAKPGGLFARDGHLFFAKEYIEGKTALQAGPLSRADTEALLAAFVEAASGLDGKAPDYVGLLSNFVIRDGTGEIVMIDPGQVQLDIFDPSPTQEHWDMLYMLATLLGSDDQGLNANHFLFDAFRDHMRQPNSQEASPGLAFLKRVHGYSLGEFERAAAQNGQTLQKSRLLLQLEKYLMDNGALAEGEAGLLEGGADAGTAPAGAEGRGLIRAGLAVAASLPAHGLFNLVQYGVSRIIYKRIYKTRNLKSIGELVQQGYLNVEKAHEIEGLITRGDFKFSGEMVDVLDEDGEPVLNGQNNPVSVDIKIAHTPGVGLRHPVVGAFIVMPDGALLFGRRAPHKSGDSELGIFGGHVMRGESRKAALERELKEELGLRRLKGKLTSVVLEKEALGYYHEVGGGTVYIYEATRSDERRMKRLQARLNRIKNRDPELFPQWLKKHHQETAAVVEIPIDGFLNSVRKQGERSFMMIRDEAFYLTALLQSSQQDKNLRSRLAGQLSPTGMSYSDPRQTAAYRLSALVPPVRDRLLARWYAQRVEGFVEAIPPREGQDGSLDAAIAVLEGAAERFSEKEAGAAVYAAAALAAGMAVRGLEQGDGRPAALRARMAEMAMLRNKEVDADRLMEELQAVSSLAEAAEVADGPARLAGEDVALVNLFGNAGQDEGYLRQILRFGTEGSVIALIEDEGTVPPALRSVKDLKIVRRSELAEWGALDEGRRVKVVSVLARFTPSFKGKRLQQVLTYDGSPVEFDLEGLPNREKVEILLWAMSAIFKLKPGELQKYFQHEAEIERILSQSA
jgi:8-oxo-dGTP pyrophosphatase MutT (NUDIX family)